MSLALLFPFALAALAGLFVPLLIHLIRHPEQKIIDFAALRWLRESLRPRRRPRFDDLWLLLTRLVLLCLLALLLAGPILNGEWRGARHVIAVSTDADLAAARAKMSDKNAEWVWLAADFPSVDSTITRTEQPQASLLRELDASLSESDRLTVIVTDEFAGLDGQRIALGRRVDWLEVPAAPKLAETVHEPEPAVVAIRSDAADRSSGLRYLQAATSVWKTADGNAWQVDDQPASSPLPGKLDGLIWMSAALPDAVLSWIRKGGRALVVDDPHTNGFAVWRNEFGDIVASDEAVGAGHVIHLRGPLTPATLPDLLDADFPERLQALLLPVPKPPDRAYSGEVKPVPVDRIAAERKTSLSSLLCLLIALVFLIERALATRRRLA